MIMPTVSSNQLLLPVNPVFLWFTLAVAAAINIIPTGRVVAMPDVLAVVMVFWNVHQPRRVGIAAAFVFGLMMDVHEGALLGQHALAYTLLSYMAITVHRRLIWFNLVSQAVQVGGMFAITHLVSLAVRMATGAGFPGWTLVLAPVAEACLWPVVVALLLAPQRRPPDPDKHRPL